MKEYNYFFQHKNCNEHTIILSKYFISTDIIFIMKHKTVLNYCVLLWNLNGVDSTMGIRVRVFKVIDYFQFHAKFFADTKLD